MVAIALLWRLLPEGAPPIYDGLCTPETYRLLGQSPPPSPASMTYPGVSFPAAEVHTSEMPTQAQVLMMASTFSSSSTITVSVTPVAPPALPPAGLVQDGNAYRIIATSAGQGLEPQSGMPVTVELRGTGVSSALTMYVNSGDGWQPLRTFNNGCGFTFEAVSAKLGYFALFRPPTSSSSSGFATAVIAGVLAALIVLATLGLARLGVARRRKTQE